MNYQWVVILLGAYVLGSIPFGKIIARKVADIDITAHGSGNIGATNVSRQLGVRWGLITLVLDALKGFLPVILAIRCAEQANLLFFWGVAGTGTAALLGHQFSIFQRFRGGKGVATALGIYLALAPLPALLAVLLFVVVVWKWNYVSLGSLVSAFSLPIFIMLFGKPVSLGIGALVMALLISLKHRDNIIRLVRGRESPWRKPA